VRLLGLSSKDGSAQDFLKIATIKTLILMTPAAYREAELLC
jgi:hypothetical protein